MHARGVIPARNCFTNFNKCRTSCWRMCRHLTGFLTTVTLAPTDFASDNPFVTACSANSDPSVGMRICRYMLHLSIARAITPDIRTVRHGHEAAARHLCELRQPAVNLLGAVRRHGQRLHRGGSGGPNPTTAARSASKSRPKWLRLSEGEVGTLRILEHGCDARLLTARKTTRSECLLGAALALIAAGVLRIDDLFAQSLMHRDVIQVAE